MEDHEMNRNARKRSLSGIFILALLLLASMGIALVSGHHTGYTGASTTGCTCHGSSASSGVNVTLTGLPASYTPMTKYPLTLTITGGPSPSGTNKGGFDLSASAGVLAVPSGSTSVQIIDGEATHTASGAAQRQWSIDWIAPVQGTGTVTFNMAGNSVNGDGAPTGDQWNRATYTVTETASVDNVPPVITINFPTEGQQFPAGTTQVPVSGTTSDNVAVSVVEVSTDGTNWQQAAGITSWSATLTVSAGTYTLHVRAKDPSNNIGTATVNITIKSPSDTQAPNILITAPTEGQKFIAGSNSVNISGSASDNVAVTLVEVSSNGVSWSPATGTTSWKAVMSVQTGNNTLHARARDAAGNSKTVTVNITVQSSSGDQVPPTIKITDPVTGQVLSANATTYPAKGTSTDNIGVLKVEVSTDGVTWSLAAGTTDWHLNISVRTGPNTVLARAIDTAGNTGLDQVSFTVAPHPPPPDTTPPVLKVDAPLEGANLPFGTKQVTVKGSASDEHDVKDVSVSTDGINYTKAAGNTSWSLSLSVIPGAYHLTIKAEDLSNNIATQLRNFTVLDDITPPALFITSHSNGATLRPGTTSIKLAGQAMDDGTVASVQLSKDNKTWQPATGTTAWSAQMSLHGGKNILYVKAVDGKGNTAYASVEVTVLSQTVDLWPVHVVLLTVTFLGGLGMWLTGWRIRRFKGPTPPDQRGRRRKLHILMGPVFTTLMFIGLVGGLWARYLVRGVIFTTLHGYLAVATVILYAFGGVIGTYMAKKRPTDLLRRVHLVLQTVATVFLGLTIIEGILLVISLRLL